MTGRLKEFRAFGAILAADLALAAYRPSLGAAAVAGAAGFLASVLAIVPTVLVIMALFDVWVPRQVIEEHVGPRSGAKGLLLSLLLGTVAAGPLYAAFPIARSLQQKGARLAAVVLFLGAWGTLKIPMLLLEGSFVGTRFALLRLALTAPGILAIGFLMERLLPPSATSSAEPCPPA